MSKAEIRRQMIEEVRIQADDFRRRADVLYSLIEEWEGQTVKRGSNSSGSDEINAVIVEILRDAEQPLKSREVWQELKNRGVEITLNYASTLLSRNYQCRLLPGRLWCLPPSTTNEGEIINELSE